MRINPQIWINAHYKSIIVDIIKIASIFSPPRLFIDFFSVANS